MGDTRQSGSRRKAVPTDKKKEARKKPSSRQASPKREDGIWGEVRLVAFLIASVFLFISNFGFGGKVGGAVSDFMFGCLGLMAYGFPVVVLFLVLFFLANRENWIAAVKMAGTVVGCIALDALLHMLTMARTGVEGWKEIFAYCAENHVGGGLLGGCLSGFLKGAFGTIGAYLILLGILIICIVIVTERSFVRGVSKGSQKVYDTARQDMERRRALREQKQRQQRKVSGVTTNLTIPKRKKEGLLELDPEPDSLSEEEDLPADVPLAQGKTEEKPPVRQEGLEEITFNEEDLLKNALSRRELKEEKANERRREEEAVVQAQQETGKAVEELIGAESEELAGQDGSFAKEETAEYRFPSLSLLKPPKTSPGKKNPSAKLQETAQHLQQIMEDFGVDAAVTNVSQGPSVTRFEVQPAHGVKVSKIIALSDDIKLNLAVPDIRMEAPIPGKAAVGIEVPNKENSVVMLRELLESKEFQEHPSKIAFAVGKDIGGNIMVSDIAKMPHLLIAGATGSGKSVCINTLIMSILYKARPEEVKLIMIDPKVVELSAYNGIPHLLIPVVTDPKKASGALNWAVAEMMDRYQKFADSNVRNIEGYNSKVDSIAVIEDHRPEKMPQIVIIVDELADLMMVAASEVEDAICRLAQLARAAGIHLIIATQRPSVNVITGLIKANMPSRIAFAVSSGVDSRTILDMNGAEKLLGKGDMLFSPYGLPKPLRVQGAFVSDGEVAAVVEALSVQGAGASGSRTVEEKMKQMQVAMESAASPAASGGGSDRDALFPEAGRFIIEKDKASIGMLQRWFKIGFNRAARIMDQLAEAGVVGEEEGTKPRKVLMSMEEFEQYVDEHR